MIETADEEIGRCHYPTRRDSVSRTQPRSDMSQLPEEVLCGECQRGKDRGFYPKGAKVYAENYPMSVVR